MPPQTSGEWYAFESAIANIFEILGLENVRQHVNIAGQQFDIYMEERIASNRFLKTIVECKFQTRQVDKNQVTQFSILSDSLKVKGEIDKAIMVAYKGFTNDAKLVAGDSNIELLSFAELEKKLDEKDVTKLKISSELIQHKAYSWGTIVQTFIRKAEEEGLPDKFEDLVFVLMPFSFEMKDIYWYGIRGSIEKLGLKCARADEIENNSDIIKEIFDHIKRAKFIVAEVSEKNPNIFYEVGYCHALGINPILVARKGTEIPFDLKTQSHIFYESIKDLEDKLTNRLEALVLSK
ncbi:MAG: hypothetical protein B6D58_09760 [candidate division Zixibacteria bacterium 4484_95]|nr:MAG: hypothetical protein B6D58_09760 [candidate division Zixibacteria bacterium 4484_95]